MFKKTSRIFKTALTNLKKSSSDQNAKTFHKPLHIPNSSGFLEKMSFFKHLRLSWNSLSQKCLLKVSPLDKMFSHFKNCPHFFVSMAFTLTKSFAFTKTILCFPAHITKYVIIVSSRFNKRVNQSVRLSFISSRRRHLNVVALTNVSSQLGLSLKLVPEWDIVQLQSLDPVWRFGS